MAFSYDNRTSAGTLVYQLSPAERVDQDAYGMLHNNRVEHIAEVGFKQIDDRRELRYEVANCHAARDFFARHAFSKEQFVAILMGVADAFANAEEYMLSERSFAGSLDTLFIDDSLNVILVYVPIVGFEGCAGAQSFLIEVRRCLNPNSMSGDFSYIQAIDRALGQSGFSLAEFKKLLASLTLKPKAENAPSLGLNQGFAPRDNGAVTQNGEVVVSGVAPSNGAPLKGISSGASSGDSGGFGNMGGLGGNAPITPGGPSGMTGSRQMAIPGPSGAPMMVGGIAIPGGGQAAVNMAKSEKKGLFGGFGKKDKPPKTSKSSGKMSRAEKKQAKLAEKAVKEAEKRAKKQQKKGKGGLFSHRASGGINVPPGPQQGMAVPGLVPTPASTPVPTPTSVPTPAPSPMSTSATNPMASQMGLGNSYGQVGGQASIQSGNIQQTISPLQPLQPATQQGDTYSNEGFGVTEVFGVGPTPSSGAVPRGGAASSFGAASSDGVMTGSGAVTGNGAVPNSGAPSNLGASPNFGVPLANGPVSNAAQPNRGMPTSSVAPQIGNAPTSGVEWLAQHTQQPASSGPMHGEMSQGLPVRAYLYRVNTRERRLIDKTPFRIGRLRSEVDFHIPEKKRVSRVHAVITFDGTRFLIRDNKSANYTEVNGRILEADESAVLKNGDNIILGDETFTFMLG